MANIAKDARVIIVGAGCFGLSTAYHLQKRGYTNILLLERAEQHPAPDAASTDINKIVRSAYADPFYTSFAREAIELWKDTEIWGDCYKESGVVVLAADVSILGESNIQLVNERAAGAVVRELRTGHDIAAAFPATANPATPDDRSGYYNAEGGWADAEGAIKRLAGVVVGAGAKILTGHEVVGLAYDAFGIVAGVKVKGQTLPVEADIVVVASGAWTVSSFPDPELKLNARMVATGQSVVTIRLTPEETERYKDIPVVLDFDTGFYCFPPTKDGVMKMSRHYAGVINPGSIPEADLDETPQSVTSIPVYRRPDLASRPNSTSHSAIPLDIAKLSRLVLRELFPELGDKPFESGRMCWYTDTTDSDWIIDFHPTHRNVLFVTGGSGHGFKFLPNIGRLASDRLEGSLELHLAEKFAIALDKDEKRVSAEVLRRVRNIDKSDLCFVEDLDPIAKLPSLKEDGSWRKTMRSVH